MPKKIQIDIKEGLDFLEKSIAKSSSSLKQDRIKTLFCESVAKKIEAETQELNQKRF